MSRCVLLSLLSKCFFCHFVGDHPGLDLLWFGNGHEVSALRLAVFLAIFDCQDFSDLYAAIEEHLFAAICLVTYTVIQVKF